MLKAPFRCLLLFVGVLSWPVFFSFLPVGAAHAASPLSWTRCRYQQSRHVQCATYPIRKPHRTVVGSSYRCRAAPHGLVCRRFPMFQAAPQPRSASAPFQGYRAWLHVTGYCLTGVMADGQGVYSGAVASNVLPFGTAVYIPSLGYHGVIADRGDSGMGSVGLDLWFPSCSMTYAVTGWREVFVG